MLARLGRRLASLPSVAFGSSTPVAGMVAYHQLGPRWVHEVPHRPGRAGRLWPSSSGIPPPRRACSWRSLRGSPGQVARVGKRSGGRRGGSGVTFHMVLIHFLPGGLSLGSSSARCGINYGASVVGGSGLRIRVRLVRVCPRRRVVMWRSGCGRPGAACPRGRPRDTRAHLLLTSGSGDGRPAALPGYWRLVGH